MSLISALAGPNIDLDTDHPVLISPWLCLVTSNNAGTVSWLCNDCFLSNPFHFIIIIIIIIYLSWSWATCRPVPVSRIQEVSSKVYHDSFCQLDSSFSLPWVIYFEVFYLYRGNNYRRSWTEPAYMVQPCSKNGRRKITQNSIEVDAETKESTRKPEGKLDGRYKEGHERKKPKWRPVGR